jgi:hypothetical protein
MMPLRRFLFPFLIMLLATRSVLAAPEPLDRIVAVVNDSVITSTELADRVQLCRRRTYSRGRCSSAWSSRSCRCSSPRRPA